MNTVLSTFLKNIGDAFRDFWSNASYLLVDSFFQLGECLGFILVASKNK